MNSAERHEARFQRRRAARQAREQARAAACGGYEEVFSFENLYDGGKQCCNKIYGRVIYELVREGESTMFIILNRANLVVSVTSAVSYVRAAAGGLPVVTTPEDAEAVYSADADTFYPLEASAVWSGGGYRVEEVDSVPDVVVPGFYYYSGEFYTTPEKEAELAAERAQRAAPAAASITFVTLAEAGQLDDATAGEHAEQFAEWVYPIDYKTGKWTKWGKLPYINYAEEEIDMTKDELKVIIRETVEEVLDDRNPVYKDVSDVPDYWRPTAEAMLEAGAINGGTTAEECATDVNIRKETLKAAVVAVMYHDAREKAGRE